jgi:ribosomal protein S18 acetylase RimI-like enzyme
MRWTMRPFAPTADRDQVERLWLAAMPSEWPLLTDGIAQLSAGLIAEAGSDVIGLVAMDKAGSIPLILVAPPHQRRGIGTALLTAALDRLRADGVTHVTAASGGDSYIWPGVPSNLPAAVRFFTARGWWHTDDALDLVTDLAGYRPPSGAHERAASRGITITRPGSADLPGVLAFEAATFPSWTRWFTGVSPHQVLTACDQAGDIAGALLLDGPGAETVFAPMLGPDAATIGCVGVAPPRHGEGIGTALVVRASEILRDAGARNCHIGWTGRESFYRRAGYEPWRRYVMFSSPA